MFPILNPPPSSLPIPFPYHSSGSFQCTSPKHPVSCIEPGLATRFIHDILHVSMPFSQIFPTLSLSHRVHKTVLYISVFFAVSYTGLLLPSSLPAEPPGKPKNTGMGSLSLLQQIFPTQELNWGLLHCRWILYQLSDPLVQE